VSREGASRDAILYNPYEFIWKQWEKKYEKCRSRRRWKYRPTEKVDFPTQASSTLLLIASSRFNTSRNRNNSCTNSEWLNFSTITAEFLFRYPGGPCDICGGQVWLQYFHVDPSGRAVYGMVLRPLCSWNCGFESRRGHECLSLMIVVWCQVQFSATVWSFVQRSPTECMCVCVSECVCMCVCVCVCECDNEASTLRKPLPTMDCQAMQKNVISPLSILIPWMFHIHLPSKAGI
jgi:hypothetical protein